MSAHNKKHLVTDIDSHDVTGAAAFDLLRVNAAVTALEYIPAGSNGQVLTLVAGAPSWTAAGGGWGLTGNAGTNPAINFVGTTDVQPVAFRAGGVGAGFEWMRILPTGEVGIGTTSPLQKLDVRGEGQIWKNTTVINPIASIADKGFTVDYTTYLTGVNPYIVGNGGIITYTSIPTVSVGGVFGTFGMVYFNDTSASSLAGIGSAPVLSGIAGKVWIEQSDSTITRVAGVSSYFAVKPVIGGNVTDVCGYWCGWDDIVNDATIATNYYGYFMPDLSTIVGVTPASNRWGIYIEDNSNNYLRGKTKLGTGTSTTGYTLEVEGTLKFVTGVPGFGKVLTSDATGVATWSTPAFSGVATIAQGGTNTGSQTANRFLYFNGSIITSDPGGTFNPSTGLFNIDFGNPSGVGISNVNTSYLGDINGVGAGTRIIVDDQIFDIKLESSTLTIGSSLITYTFPSAQGAANTYLKNDGTGILSWQTVFTLPALTAGSVIFSNGTTLAQDNANFFWNDATNRLGIGTATPSARLQVAGDFLTSAVFTDGNVGIGTATPNSDAILDLTSVNKALLIPRVDSAAQALIIAVDGMIVYNTNSIPGGQFEGYQNGVWVAL